MTKNICYYKNNIIKLYKQGYSCAQIGYQFNVSKYKIWLNLRRWGISINKYTSPKIQNIDVAVLQHFLQTVKIRAKRKNLVCTITIKDIVDLYIKQNKKCALSGINLYFDSQYRQNDGNISLDRKDNKKGYSKNNCQLVDKKINISKHILSDQEYILLCQKVVNWTNHTKNK